MITIDALVVEIGGIAAHDVERWIGRLWVRPDGEPGAWRFREIDVARVRLIRELREEMRVAEETLPLVLSLLDQLYEERRRLRRLRDVLDGAEPASREALLRRLIGTEE